MDIVIGTHKLIQDDVKFKQLGLMIIDEEHRFGVRHKERIKALQTNIDSLSMTATPIPRTLNMALSGMQDISIIATPPARRLAIKTFYYPNLMRQSKKQFYGRYSGADRYIIYIMMLLVSRQQLTHCVNWSVKHE